MDDLDEKKSQVSCLAVKKSSHVQTPSASPIDVSILSPLATPPRRVVAASGEITLATVAAVAPFVPTLGGSSPEKHGFKHGLLDFSRIKQKPHVMVIRDKIHTNTKPPWNTVDIFDYSFKTEYGLRTIHIVMKISDHMDISQL